MASRHDWRSRIELVAGVSVPVATPGGTKGSDGGRNLDATQHSVGAHHALRFDRRTQVCGLWQTPCRRVEPTCPLEGRDGLLPGRGHSHAYWRRSLPAGRLVGPAHAYSRMV